MELDPKSYYRMPLIMGPMWTGDVPSFTYPQSEIVAFQYLTERENIRKLLPGCFEVGKEPLVTILFAYHNGLDYMAGAGYTLSAIQVAARFDGNEDHIEGDYVLVMFENQPWPMICGREDLGIPKLYADISPIKVYSDGKLRCQASYWGHLLYHLEISPPKKQNKIAVLAARKIINSRPWLGYKYIPSLDGPPDANYPTISYNDTKIDHLWLADRGAIKFGDADAREIGQVKNIIDALSTLPILKIKQALHFQGSSQLRYDLSRRLV